MCCDAATHAHMYQILNADQGEKHALAHRCLPCSGAPTARMQVTALGEYVSKQMTQNFVAKNCSLMLEKAWILHFLNSHKRIIAFWNNCRHLPYSFNPLRVFVTYVRQRFSVLQVLCCTVSALHLKFCAIMTMHAHLELLPPRRTCKKCLTFDCATSCGYKQNSLASVCLLVCVNTLSWFQFRHGVRNVFFF